MKGRECFKLVYTDMQGNPQNRKFFTPEGLRQELDRRSVPPENVDFAIHVTTSNPGVPYDCVGIDANGELTGWTARLYFEPRGIRA